MKTCKKCQETLPMDAFHRHSGFKDGRRVICSKCSCITSREYYANNREKHMDVCRDWQKRNREKVLSYQVKAMKKRKSSARNWIENNPQRARAQKSLNYAVFKGQVKRNDSCQVCGCESNKLQGHHYDYSKPLEVIWVCTKCHGWIHRRRPTEELAIA